MPQRAHHPQPARQQRRAQLLQVHLARRRGGRDSRWPWGGPGAGRPAGGLVAMGWQSRRFRWRRARQPGSHASMFRRVSRRRTNLPEPERAEGHPGGCGGCVLAVTIMLTTTPPSYLSRMTRGDGIPLRILRQERSFIAALDKPKSSWRGAAAGHPVLQTLGSDWISAHEPGTRASALRSDQRPSETRVEGHPGRGGDKGTLPGAVTGSGRDRSAARAYRF